MEEIKNCIVCDRPLTSSGHSHEGGQLIHFYDCANCGAFALDTYGQTLLPNYFSADTKKAPILRAALSHYIYRVQSNSPWALIPWPACERILSAPSFPSLQEQANNLIIWLAEHSPAPGELVAIRFVSDQAKVGSPSARAFIYVVDYLHSKHLISADYVGSPKELATIKVRLNFEGWEQYSVLLSSGIKSRHVFLAMEYGHPEVDSFYDDFVRKAVRATGFNLSRLDDKPKAGLIDDRMRVDIRNAFFLIADLTHANNGAYWEAGFAEGLGKQVIYLCRKDVFDSKGVHFDTSHLLTIDWDPEAPEKATERLKASIRATFPEDAKQEDL